MIHTASKDQPRSPTADRRALADALRRLRDKSGLSLDDAASRALDASGAKLSRIETGRQVAGPRDVRDLCALYKVPAARAAELISWASSAREPAWWEAFSVNDDDYVGLESAATHTHEFAASFIPGLLQTKAYAEAFVGTIIGPGRLQPWTDSQVQEWLEILELRQAAVRPESGVELSFVIDEAALLRAVGGSAMREQIEHLITVSEQPNVDLRVLRLMAGASPGQRGGFGLLTMPHGPDIAYVESQGGFMLIDDADELKRFRQVYKVIRDASTEIAGTRLVLQQAMNHLP